MTSPDSIWLCRHQFMGCVHEVDFHEDPDGTPYIRSDLHAALQAENERLRNANAMWVINFENVFDEGAKIKGENERLREALIKAADEIDQYIWQEYPLDHPVHERYRQRDFDANPARAALK